MTMKTLIRLLSLCSLLIVGTSCNKEKDTIARVKVVDVDGYPVAGAYVKLFANLAYPQGDASRLRREGSTDSNGMVEFDYTQQYKQGQAGFAVLDIVSFKDSAVGEGIIKILEEEENEETVTLEPVN
jgi:uncharacterized GH25 family protein